MGTILHYFYKQEQVLEFLFVSQEDSTLWKWGLLPLKVDLSCKQANMILTELDPLKMYPSTSNNSIRAFSRKAFMYTSIWLYLGGEWHSGYIGTFTTFK